MYSYLLRRRMQKYLTRPTGPTNGILSDNYAWSIVLDLSTVDRIHTEEDRNVTLVFEWYNFIYNCEWIMFSSYTNKF